MASPPFNIAETVPGDSDIASQFPALERTYRDVVESWLNVNHNNLGQHRYVELEDRAAVFPSITSGNIGIWNSSGFLNTRLGAGTVDRVLHMVAGTKMLFLQNSVPVGWTLDAGTNDVVLRMSNFAGGSLGGSWTVSGLTTQNHTLTVGEIPPHQHNVPTRVSANGQFTGLGGVGWNADGSGVTDACPSCGGGAHNHGAVASDATWRPAYITVIAGTLN